MTWRDYVLRLCINTWELDPATAHDLIADLAYLAATASVTEEIIAALLVEAGVADSVAALAAPDLRAAITA